SVKLQQAWRHPRPSRGCQRIDGVVAVTCLIANPARRAAITHGDRHAVPTACAHAAEGAACGDGLQPCEQRRGLRLGEATQQDCARRQWLACGDRRLFPCEKLQRHLKAPFKMSSARSFCVMEDDTERMTAPGAQTAYAVAKVDAIHPA